MTGEWCRIEPLDIERHVTQLFESHMNNRDDRNWTYLPYGPFDREQDYRAWIETTCLGEDPLFYAVIDPKTDRALGVASYMRKPVLRSFGMAADVYGFHRHGRQIPIEISLSPIHLESGLFVLAVVTDLTEYKRTADTIKRTNESLRRSNHELEQFAYVASHDLQEPLRKMSSFCSLLAEEYGDELEGDGQV